MQERKLNLTVVEGVTPPIPIGTRLRLAEMMPLDKEWEEKVIVLAKNNQEYAGIYTGAISECIAIVILSFDLNKNIEKILMAHFPGGISEQSFPFLKNKIEATHFS